jgi:hypothetical protein
MVADSLILLMICLFWSTCSLINLISCFS